MIILFSILAKQLFLPMFIAKHKINNKLKDDKLIYWCNYFSNDYCPKRILGPPPNFKIIKISCLILLV